MTRSRVVWQKWSKCCRMGKDFHSLLGPPWICSLSCSNVRFLREVFRNRAKLRNQVSKSISYKCNDSYQLGERNRSRPMRTWWPSMNNCKISPSISLVIQEFGALFYIALIVWFKKRTYSGLNCSAYLSKRLFRVCSLVSDRTIDRKQLNWDSRSKINFYSHRLKLSVIC